MMEGEGQMAGFEYGRDRRGCRIMPCTLKVQGMILRIQRFLDKPLTIAFHNSDIRQQNCICFYYYLMSLFLNTKGVLSGFSLFLPICTNAGGVVGKYQREIIITVCICTRIGQAVSIAF